MQDQLQNNNSEVENSSIAENTGETLDSSTEPNAADNNQETYEDAARKRGWRPKEEWQGDPEDWANPKQFVRYGEMMDKIHNLKQEVSTQSKTLGHVEDLIQRREEMARQQERDALIRQRREAIQSGDVEAVEDFDQRIKKNDSFEEKKFLTKNAPPELVDWTERHKSNWFNDDTPENLEMIQYSEKVANWIGNKFPSLSLPEQLDRLEGEMRKKFPHRFGNQKRNRAASVESEEYSSAGKKGAGAPKYNTSRITPDMRMVAKAFVKNGTFKTEQEYFDDFFKKYGDK